MDKKTLVIIDHPNFSESTVNRRLVDEMRKNPDDILIHNLESVYPASIIDVAKEHCLMENSGMVVLQFPMYWFNCPPRMKEWFDRVLTSDWAFKNGHNLDNKKFAICVTCGSEEAAYTSQGRHHHKVDEFLNNLIHSLEMCNVNYVGTFVVYGINDKEVVTTEAIAKKAKEYVEFIKDKAS